jgi:hypothetical protein
MMDSFKNMYAFKADSYETKVGAMEERCWFGETAGKTGAVRMRIDVETPSGSL